MIATHVAFLWKLGH